MEDRWMDGQTNGCLYQWRLQRWHLRRKSRLYLGCLPFFPYTSGKWGKSRKSSDEVDGWVESRGEGVMHPLTFLPRVPQGSHHKQGSGALTERQTKCPGHTEHPALTGQGEGWLHWTLKMLRRIRDQYVQRHRGG